MARPTHKAVADELNVPISSVAIVREVLAGTSADAVRARRDRGISDAARWLAERRRCADAAAAICNSVIAAIREIDGIPMEEIMRTGTLFIRVSLDRIEDNPFQTRIEYGDVGELAESLLKMRPVRPETSGLLQVPPARIVLNGHVLNPAEYGGVAPCLGDEPHARVQLAAGHRRYRAFQSLHEGRDEYATFPVDVQVLDDRAMADIAWEENAKRKNLNAIEEAQALRRAMERFGWSQAKVGLRWGLSQSAVANKLRLLGLPEDAQAAIRSGQISERHGRALLKAAGKSERIYERAAEDILPPMVVLEIEKKAEAHSLVSKQHFWKVTAEGDPRCRVCGESAAAMTSGKVYWDGKEDFLCLACYRAATGWVPPSVAQAEQVIKRAIQAESRRLDMAEWPFDVVVGQGDSQIRSARCVDCQFREAQDDVEWCLDAACFKRKRVHWYGYLRARLHEHLLKIFGDTAPVDDGYDGYDLRSTDEVDVALVRDGICAPGKCKRLRFRYYTYKTVHCLKPCAELPFGYNCNNSSSHRACQQRYLKSLQNKDEAVAEDQARQEAAGRRERVGQYLARAQQSLARALLDKHDGAWRGLIRLFDSPVPGKDQSASDSAMQIARRMLDAQAKYIEWTIWNDEDSVEQAIGRVRDHMAKLGVAMLPSLDDLIRKLERIERFVLYDAFHPRSDLTLEQVDGNMDNVDKIGVQLEEMYQAQQISADDYDLFAKRLAALEQALNISREMARIDSADSE